MAGDFCCVNSIRSGYGCGYGGGVNSSNSNSNATNGPYDSSPTSNTSSSPTLTPKPNQNITLEDFIRMMGDRFKDSVEFDEITGGDGKLDWQDLDKDGDGMISREEIQVLIEKGVIDEELFNVLANAGVVRANSDGFISKEDLQEALTVIEEYAKWHGISVYEAVKIYLDPATTFENANLSALTKVRERIKQELNLDEVTDEPSLRLKLASLGYNSTVIDEVVKLITNWQNLSIDYVVTCIVKVIDKARVEGQIECSGENAKDKILSWLKGPSEEIVDDQQILNDSRFKRIFSWSARMNRRAYALDYLKQLIDEGKLEVAQRALELIVGRGHERNIPELSSLASDNEINASFANAYMDKNNLFKAFEYTQKLSSDDRKQHLLANLFERCLRDVEKYYDLARGVIEAMGSKKEISYAQLAARLLTTRNEKLRKKAVEVLEKINPSYMFSSSEDMQSLQSFASLGFPIKNGEPISVQSLINFAKDEIRWDVEVLKIRDEVFPPGSETPQLERANEALTQLQEFISEHSNDPQSVAQAVLVRAEILRAWAKLPWGQKNLGIEGMPKSEQQPKPPAGQPTASQLYLLAAEASRKASELFDQLADEASGKGMTEEAQYYSKMSERSVALIAEFVYNSRDLYEGRPSRTSTGVTLDASVRNRYKDFFKLLARFIPNGREVIIKLENGAPYTINTSIIRKKLGVGPTQQPPKVPKNVPMVPPLKLEELSFGSDNVAGPEPQKTRYSKEKGGTRSDQTGTVGSQGATPSLPQGGGGGNILSNLLSGARKILQSFLRIPSSGGVTPSGGQSNGQDGDRRKTGSYELTQPK